ncbi:MAG: alanyl-tRNA editing protein [Pseudomonadota bacterium]
MTAELFRDDGYLAECDGRIVDSVEHGLVLDQTVFFSRGGGQPGDIGTLELESGKIMLVTDCYRDPQSGLHIHQIDDPPSDIPMGCQVVARLDWQRRHKIMRLHSALHMLCAAVPAPVTGGSIREESARLDFDLPEPPDKQSIEDSVNELIHADHPMEILWISDEEMMANQHLVRTLAVAPPMGSGQVRLVKFGDADLQPCGGTHVRSSSEIGPIRIQSIKKKGRQNRRITLEFSS